MPVGDLQWAHEGACWTSSAAYRDISVRLQPLRAACRAFQCPMLARRSRTDVSAEARDFVLLRRKDAMFCFGRSAGVSVAPLQDPTAVKFGKDADIKAKTEDVPVKEDAQKMDVPHRNHKQGTGGSQAHSFVRHLIHNAASR